MTVAPAMDIPSREARPLGERLRAIPPDRAAAVTRLLGAGERLLIEADGTRLELRSDVAQEAPHATTAELNHANGRLSLVLTTEHHEARVGERSWHDFSGDARLLAWALAYEPLLMRLSELLGTPLLPAELRAAPDRQADVLHWVEFRYGQGEREDCRGLLGLDRAALDTLAAVSGWHRADAEARIERDEVPLPCRLLLPVPDLSAATLRDVGEGDVILLGSRAIATSTLRLHADTGQAALDARHAWLAAAVAGGISITRPLSAAEFRNLTMNESVAETPPALTAEDVRDSIPIRVDLLIDTLSLSLADLGRLGAGQILELRQPVEGARVELRANGKIIGSGELVSLGETLGVKVTRIGDERGLQ
ncbi:FliM/FliN family flagellar motor switch protein [Dokdonella sp.]|uniref:FliM/FliN family flagellar motor switch protein n=1 Tax=Dokdonella sp. TaxID=2291710 RepID=UPI001B2E0A62|nr:FliM/FliN family flagellar motor switch protein [Dokdonella sp.]MBO9664249.1 FliM/FliN family flagellar motor switch protein [Dokdonella sp.]